MSQHELVWEKRAEKEFLNLIERRSRKADVATCVEQQLLALAANLAVAETGTPAEERVHSFQCVDIDEEGDEVVLFVRAAVTVRPDGKVGVVRFQSPVF